MATETKPRTKDAASKTLVEKLTLPMGLLTLAAISSPISQATLAPVFGSIPPTVHHRTAVVATCALGFLLRLVLPHPPRGRIAQILAVWAFWIPVVQAYLFRVSGALGPVAGCIILGFLSCHTIIIPATYAAAEAMDDLNLKAQFGPYIASALHGLLGIFHVASFENQFRTLLPGLAVSSSIFTPLKLQLYIAAGLTYIAPSQLRLLAIPALLHTLVYNPHFDATNGFNQLNRTLSTHNWTILDRQWSNTGYISVLESLEQKYRVLRCDHSLLGGEWLLTEERRAKEGWEVDEPIYSVFEMLEAVRLMDLEPRIADTDAQALVVGLGIGTTPKALLAHGINTTIVELDPVVHEFATTYFNLPANHTAIIQDAVFWVNETAAEGNTRYDYIIHDVFTGGAEPLALFTNTFLNNLRTVLKPNGAIALNYAGDLSMPLTNKVLNTIDLVFNGQCKIFRDTPPQTSASDDDDKASINEEFTNILVFCRNTPGSVSFRKPTMADFLGSKSREHYMLPKPKLEVPFPLEDAADRSRRLQDDILKSGDEPQWSSQQAESAIKHWYVMRKVMPDAVWELW